MLRDCQTVRATAITNLAVFLMQFFKWVMNRKGILFLEISEGAIDLRRNGGYYDVSNM
jgi:hypothetical protein